MKFTIVVATHHKTGTVWMDGVFKAIANAIGCKYMELNPRRKQRPGELEAPLILFSHDSDFRDHPEFLHRGDVRILHLIRDPRDVLISAMHYHKRSTETWLHEAVPGYDNRTYQSKLNGLKTTFQQYVFEMENSTNSTIRDMMEWQYDRTNCIEARYEVLRQDKQMDCWSRIVAALGFDETEQSICRKLFWQNSLFGNLMLYGSKHVRSGDVEQWKREFTPQLATAFLERFPAVLQVLKYEPNNDWAQRLQPGTAAWLRSVVKRLSSVLSGGSTLH
jgi:hypothetical protein